MSEHHITPGEAVELSKHATYGDVTTAISIYRAYVAKDTGNDGSAFAYGACFYAGIVEGMRRERAGRRKVSDNPHVRCAVSMLRDIKSDRTLSRICQYIQLLWMQENQVRHDGRAGLSGSAPSAATQSAVHLTIKK